MANVMVLKIGRALDIFNLLAIACNVLKTDSSKSYLPLVDPASTAGEMPSTLKTLEAMKKSIITRGIAAIMAAAISCIATAAERPNIIVIYMDDMGYNDLGVMNYPGPPAGPASMPLAPGSSLDPDFPAPNAARFMTPNIDSLASGGLLMPQFYGATLCSPSRSSLLTGRYCKRVGVNGVFSPDASGDGIKGLNTTEVTLPEILRENGYATGMVGKWHLGYVPTAHDPLQMMPTRHGFQEFFGHPHSNDMTSFSLIRNETIIDPDSSGATKQAEITWRYTEAALDFIQRKSGNNKPFFLYLAPIMTHMPCWPSDRTFANADGTTWPKFQGTSGVSYYYDVVKETDHAVGRVLKKLDELGIDDKTLVIFTSDNGPWLNIGSYKGASTPNLTDISVGSAYPLREGKFTTWEGGVRVPFVARWKGKIAPGTVLNGQVGAMIDLLPTLVGLAGGSLPAGRTIDGKDLWPLWSGQTSSLSRSFAHFHLGNIEAVVKGRWKLRSNNNLHDVWNLNDQETSDHAAAQPAVVADLVAERNALAASITADSVPLGVFTAYEVLPSASDLAVTEGGATSFTVALSANPGKNVTVSVSRFSGDADLSVSAGASLIFNTTNWSTPQTVTLAAAADADAKASGATFRLTTNDITQVREVFVFENDTNAAPGMETSLVWPKADPALIANSGVKLVAEASSKLGAQINPLGSSYLWTKVSGPGNVSFTAPAAAETGLTFSLNGIYRLRLSSSHPDASAPGISEFNVDVGAVGALGSSNLKHSPPLVYDASQDTDGNLVWKNLMTPGSGDVALDSGVSPASLGDPAPALSFINSALVFPGGTPMKGGSSATLDSYSTGNATFSLWFKPDILPTPNRQVIWETGGDIGTSFILDGSSLKFVVDDGASNLVKGATASATLAPSSAQNGFVHACGVIDLANDQIHLYLDGSLASTQAIPTVSDWCGVSGTAFGRFNTTGDVQQLGGNDQLTPPIEGYAGMLAMMRFYNQALSSAAVTALHTDPLALETVANIGPEVAAGSDQSIGFTTLNDTSLASLVGSVSDDGKPLSSTFSTLWRAPAATFANATQAATTATFGLPGTYPLWLIADDSEIKVYDEMSVTVAPLTYAEWAAGIAFAPGQNDGNANPDHDDFVNRWEWALGLDPLRSNPSQPGISFAKQSIESGRRLTLEFQVPYNRLPDIYFQHSGNLQDWQTILTPDLTVVPGSASRAKWVFHYDVPATDSSKFIRSALSE